MDSYNESQSRMYADQPYDESLEVPDGDEVSSTSSQQEHHHHHHSPQSSEGPGMFSRGQSPNQSTMSDQSEDSKMKPFPPSRPRLHRSDAPKIKKSQASDNDDEDDDDDEDDSPQMEGAYDPAEFESLPVTNEIKDLFQYITRYTPQSIELEHKLKPFIPEFIPSVGDIDAFIKISRPDKSVDSLGLTVLDEPCAKQSDPSVLDLQLRALSKQTTTKSIVKVKRLESAETKPKAIEAWIDSIRDLHRSKPPPTVHYSRNMPDIDCLMQEWPADFEQLLTEVSLPTADLDCQLDQFIDIICSILDIPIYQNTNHHNAKIQALHVLFTLYSEFKNSQHFQAVAATTL